MRRIINLSARFAAMLLVLCLIDQGSAESGLVPGKRRVQSFYTDEVGVRLRFSDGFNGPGRTAVSNVSLETDLPISGVQFRVQPLHDGLPTDLIRFEGAINHLEQQGFTVSTFTNEDNVTSVLMFNLTNEPLPLGNFILMEMLYSIAFNAPLGKQIDLSVSDVILSSPDARSISFDLTPGRVVTGKPGDLAGGLIGGGDGLINILDVVKMIKMILRVIPLPLENSFEFFLADLVADQHINIQDLVYQIKVIDNPDIIVKPQVETSQAPVLAYLGDVQQPQEAGRFLLPVRPDADGVIAGVEASFTFDPSRLSLGAT